MNKVIRYLQIYLMLGFPFVIACMIWSTIHPEMADLAGFSLKRLTWEILAYNLMFWFFALILFLISLVLLPRVREKTLCYLANIKERDEREEYITGKAARFSYLFNLGLLIFLLFISIFSVNLSYSSEKPSGKRTNVQIGLGFSLFENNPKTTPKTISQDNQAVVSNYNYSPSKTTILLILLICQLVAFNLAARREKIK